MNQIRPYGIATLPDGYVDYHFYVDYEGETYYWHDIAIAADSWTDYIQLNKQKYFDDIAVQLLEWEKTKGIFITTQYADIGEKPKEVEVFIPKVQYVKPTVVLPKSNVEVLKKRVVVIEVQLAAQATKIATFEEEKETLTLQVEALEVLSVGVVEEKPIV